MLLLIGIPFAAGILVLAMTNRSKAKDAAALVAMAANFALAVFLFNKNTTILIPWAGFGIDLSFRVYNFNAFIIAAAAFFGLLVTLYSSSFLNGKSYAKFFYGYLLLSFGFINGAVLADNLVVMLFFWEGLLLTQFGLIAIGGKQSFNTAKKALIISGACDLAMMAGIIMVGILAGTFSMSHIHLPVAGLGGVAFILMMIGAIGKGGSMPFHSWIPDAATDAPLPFMAIVPASLEKLLGIYLLTRIAIDFFKASPHSWASVTLMTIGAITIVLAVMMALVQKEFKRLLSYHAISQLGYMILGIGTFLPVGIVGGIFHMINNALYKNCLFLSGGSVEKQAGTTDLEKLGGIAKNMPITFICFFITAASISGVPPFNGFFSKELVYDGALERGSIFYLAAIAGSFLTAASFLKLGHAAFLGKRADTNKNVREASVSMLIPMAIIAIICIIFGVYNFIPLKLLIQPIVGAERLEGHSFEGMPADPALVYITVAVLLMALLNHIFGVIKTKSALKAADHIHYAPVLGWIYDKAEKGYLDPYNIGLTLTNIFANIASFVDKAIDYFYNDFLVGAAGLVSYIIKKAHTGSYRMYLIWSAAAVSAIVIFLIRNSVIVGIK